MAENIPNLKKKTYIQKQEIQQIPDKMKPSRLKEYIVITMAKVKDERILKAAREK